MALLFFIIFILIVVLGIGYFLWKIKNISTHAENKLRITPVEIITIIIIFVVSVLTVLPAQNETEEIPLSAIAEERINALVTALTMYRFDIAAIPSEEDGLEGLLVNMVGNSTWRGPYIMSREILIDPWGRPYQYKLKNGNYEILSLGADNKSGGTGENRDLLRQE